MVAASRCPAFVRPSCSRVDGRCTSENACVSDLASAARCPGLQHPRNRGRCDRAVRQQGRRVDCVVPGKHAGRRQRTGVYAVLGVLADPLLGQVRWVRFWVSRSRCASTIAPSAAVISSAEVTSKANTYLVNSSCASPFGLPSGCAWPRPPARRTPRCRPRHQQDREAEVRQSRRAPLAPDRLHQGVGRVHADQHQHEQEQHHDRAGVDDDLHGEQERRSIAAYWIARQIITVASSSASAPPCGPAPSRSRPAP